MYTHFLKVVVEIKSEYSLIVLIKSVTFVFKHVIIQKLNIICYNITRIYKYIHVSRHFM